MDLSKTIFIQILQWAPKKTHLFCNKVHIRRSRSSKVDNFGTNRKCVCDFRHCDYGPILHCFWDTATYWLKIAYFLPPLLFGAPAPYKLMFRLEFRAEVNHEETRVSRVLQWRPHDRIVSRFDMIPAFDRPTVSQTDVFNRSYSTALCVASYADAVTRCKNSHWK